MLKSFLGILFLGILGLAELFLFLFFDYATGLPNINKKTPGTGPGRSRLIERCAVAKSQSCRNALNF
jgi:hypothetical protein